MLQCNSGGHRRSSIAGVVAPGEAHCSTGRLSTELHCSTATGMVVLYRSTPTTAAALHCSFHVFIATSPELRRPPRRFTAASTVLRCNLAGAPTTAAALHCSFDDASLQPRRTRWEPAKLHCSTTRRRRGAATNQAVATKMLRRSTRCRRSPMLPCSSPQLPDCSMCDEWQPISNTVVICSSGGHYHAAPRDSAPPPHTMRTIVLFVFNIDWVGRRMQQASRRRQPLLFF